MVVVNGTNFPATGYAFPQNSVAAAYFNLGCELYGNSGNMTLELHWYSRSGSTSGNVTWSVQLAAITPNDAISVEAKSFASAQTTTTAVNTTAKGDTLSTVTISNLDSANVGDDLWIKVTRTDTSMTGDAILIRGSLSYSDGNSGTAGSGDVVGPASATTTAIALYNGTTGKLIQNSAVTVDPSGNFAGVGTLNGVFTPKFHGVCRVSTDQTIAVTTITNVTNMSFALPAAGSYSFRFDLIFNNSTATATLGFACTCATATAFAMQGTVFTTAAVPASLVTLGIATTTNLSPTRTIVAATNTGAIFSGTVTVSAAGTLQFQAITSVVNLVVKAGSGGACDQQ